jgi:hypothetical protein
VTAITAAAPLVIQAAREMSGQADITAVEVIMSDIAGARASGARRIYKFRHPVAVPFFAIGMARDKMKRAGIWEKLPQRLRQKAKVAQESWSAMIVTRQDMDSIPDDVWARLARTFDLEWGYAEAAAACQERALQA